MVHPLGGAEGFLRYLGLRGGGATQAEVRSAFLQPIIEEGGAEVEGIVEAVEGELRRRLAERDIAVEAAFGEVDRERVKITEAALETLATLRTEHRELVASAKEAERLVQEMMTSAQEKEEQLKELNETLFRLRSGLSSGLTDPAWINLEELRKRGREYAQAQGVRR